MLLSNNDYNSPVTLSLHINSIFFSLFAILLCLTFLLFYTEICSTAADCMDKMDPVITGPQSGNNRTRIIFVTGKPESIYWGNNIVRLFFYRAVLQENCLSILNKCRIAKAFPHATIHGWRLVTETALLNVCDLQALDHDRNTHVGLGRLRLYSML